MGKGTGSVQINHKIVRKLPPWSEKDSRKAEGQHVFIIGSKGIPAFYGGFETFVEKLTKHRVSVDIHYHVARMAEDDIHYEYNHAECFDVNSPRIGAARAVWYDLAALSASIRWCQDNPGIRCPVFYILACRIGPFIGYFKKKIEKIGGILYLNPDGHEWKRSKWNRLVRFYWKVSERLMVKYADLLICDSEHIELYIQKEYAKYNPKTVFIAYGSDGSLPETEEKDSEYTGWLEEKGLKAGEYYLAVSRFVPENNFETMIREFMLSGSRRDFAIVTTENKKFYQTLERRLHFSRDKRIKFVGTVYDTELLKRIRKNAYAYLHGHEVGGTNPSLLESLGITDMNLLLDVGFNREVAQSSAFYWTKDHRNLADLLEKTDAMCPEEIHEMGVRAKERIRKAYRWEFIVDRYESIFLNHEADSA